MKRKILLLFFIASVSIFARGQTSVYHPFPDSNAVWNINVALYGGCGPPLYLTKTELFTYVLSGDTVLNSYSYHKVFVPFVFESCSGPGTAHYQSAGYKGCLREDTIAQKVYFIYPNDSIDSLLYDFTLQAGDTIRGIFGDNLSCWSGYPALIDSVDSVLVNGNYRKRWNYGVWTTNSIIEGIGSVSGLLDLVCQITDAPYAVLTCFKQDGTIIYTSPSFPSTSCDIIDGLTAITDEVPIEIFPNPATSEFTIYDLRFTILNVEIYDLPGRIIFSQLVTSNQKQVTINVSSLTPGIYFVRVKTEKGILSEKFVKQ